MGCQLQRRLVSLEMPDCGRPPDRKNRVHCLPGVRSNGDPTACLAGSTEKRPVYLWLPVYRYRTGERLFSLNSDPGVNAEHLSLRFEFLGRRPVDCGQLTAEGRRMIVVEGRWLNAQASN